MESSAAGPGQAVWEPEPLPRSLLAGTPWSLLAALGGFIAAVAGLAAVDVLPPPALVAVSVAASHGALLATALAWSGHDAPSRQAPSVAVLLVLLGAGAAAMSTAGALAYLGTPLWLLCLARRRQLLGLGLGTGTTVFAAALGLGLGAALAGHMLLCARLTFGYRPLEAGVAPVVLASAYDVGAQVLATECFFRGALFNRAQRRWSFGTACALSTALTIIRYLADPLLPGAAEVRAGAAFYTGLLGVGNCWLFWRFGTLVPAMIASSVFFVAYRVLVAR